MYTTYEIKKIYRLTSKQSNNQETNEGRKEGRKGKKEGWKEYSLPINK